MEIAVGLTIVIPGSVDPGMHFGLEVKRLTYVLDQVTRILTVRELNQLRGPPFTHRGEGEEGL